MKNVARSLLPLNGVKVIDFGQYIAGPAIAKLLADLGAMVVHINPTGDLCKGKDALIYQLRKKIILFYLAILREKIAPWQSFLFTNACGI